MRSPSSRAALVEKVGRPVYAGSGFDSRCEALAQIPANGLLEGLLDRVLEPAGAQGLLSTGQEVVVDFDSSASCHAHSIY